MLASHSWLAATSGAPQKELPVSFTGASFAPLFSPQPPPYEYTPFPVTHSYEFFDRTVDRFGLRTLGPLVPVKTYFGPNTEGVGANAEAYLAGIAQAEKDGYEAGYSEGYSGRASSQKKATATSHETFRRGTGLVAGSGVGLSAPAPRPAAVADTSSTERAAALAQTVSPASTSSAAHAVGPPVLFGVSVEPVSGTPGATAQHAGSSAAAEEQQGSNVAAVVLRAPAPIRRDEARGGSDSQQQTAAARTTRGGPRDEPTRLSVPAEVFEWR